MGITRLLRQTTVTAAAVLATAAAAATWWWLHRRGLPTTAEATQWLRQPLTAHTLAAAALMALAVTAAFTLAAAIKVALLAQAARRGRRRTRVRFRPPTVVRSVTAALVGTAGIAGLSDPAAALAASGANGAPADPDSDDRATTTPGWSDDRALRPADRSATAVGTGHIPAAQDPPAGVGCPGAVRRPIVEDRLDAARSRPATSRLTADRLDHDEPTQAGHLLGTRQGLDPPRSTTSAPVAGPPPVYEVRHADWLGRIAQRFLGSFDRYPEIQRLNPDLIDDADHIEPTWRIVLPADAHDHGRRPHATGHLAVNPPPDAERRDPAPTTPPAPPGPERTAPPDAATPDPTPTGPPSTGTGSSATAAPSTPTDAATTAPGATSGPSRPGSAASATGDTGTPPPATTDDRDHGGGVPLPGGWISLPFAAAVVAAGAMVWLQRRRRYVPRPLSWDTRDDPDLRPLPPVMARVHRAVRRQAPQLLEPTDPPPTVADYLAVAPDQRPPLPPVGPSGPDLAGLGNRIRAGGLGLTGPGAEAAARAVLVATLSAGSPNDPDAAGQIIIPAQTLTRLLGADAAQFGSIPRLQVTADLSDALDRADQLLIERRRVLQDYAAADVAGLRAADPYHPPMPPVLLLTDSPPTQLRERVTTVLHLGAPVQVSAVVLGDSPSGDTLTVEADGHAGAPGDRLAVLDAATAVQLLQVLREAHTGEPTDTTTANGGSRVDRAGPQAAGDEVPDGGRPQNEPDTPTGPPTTVPTATTPPRGDAPPASGADPGPPARDSRDPVQAGQTPSTATVPPASRDDTAPVSSRDDTAPVPRDRRSRVRLTVLGIPAIHDHDGRTVPGLRHHARELLVYLAVHRGGADLPDIMEAFWPTATVPRARERLSTEVGDLRRRIRQAAGDKDIQPVVNTGGRYHLDPSVVEVDLWRLVDTLRQANTATGPDVRASLLRQAIDARTGILAQGYDYDWIEQPREHLRRHGIRARVQLADLIGDADPTEAADLTRAAATLDPINEDLARRAMRTLARAGNVAAVHPVFDDLRSALADIDEEPSAATIALVADLERGTGDDDRLTR